MGVVPSSAPRIWAVAALLVVSLTAMPALSAAVRQAAPPTPGQDATVTVTASAPAVLAPTGTPIAPPLFLGLAGLLTGTWLVLRHRIGTRRRTRPVE